MVYHLEANNGSTDAVEDCTLSVVAADSAYSCFEPGTVALEAGPKRGRLAECLRQRGPLNGWLGCRGRAIRAERVHFTQTEAT